VGITEGRGEDLAGWALADAEAEVRPEGR
jgi:hypothetical protein